MEESVRRDTGLSNREPLLFKCYCLETLENGIRPAGHFSLPLLQYRLLFYCVIQSVDFYQNMQL